MRINLYKNKKKFLVLAIMIIVAVGLIVNSSMPNLGVLSVDRIWLTEQGYGVEDGAVTNSWWRVEATTQDSTEVKFIQFNQSLIDGKPDSTVPTDFNVLGNIYVNVVAEKPYYHIPIVAAYQDLEVTPTVYSTDLDKDFWGVDYYTKGTTSVSPVTCTIWRTNLETLQVYIPFLVTVQKTTGENPNFFITSDGGTKLADGSHRFVISQSDLTATSHVFTFYNPDDDTEKVKFTLQYSFGDFDKSIFSTGGLLFITDAANGVISSQNTFHQYDLTKIYGELNWRSSDTEYPMKFANYWFGGGNAFQGTCYEKDIFGNWITCTGGFYRNGEEFTSAVVIDVTGDGISEIGQIAEGYTSTGTYWGTYEYAGWTMQDIANQIMKPERANLFAGRSDVQPTGLSVVDYLASNTQAPVTGNIHTPISRVNPNIWNEGMGGYAQASGYYDVYLPQGSRNWLFTIDVSTEACDTVVVQQSYIDMKIQSATIDKTSLASEEYATVTATIKNVEDVAGTGTIGITAPENMVDSSTITGNGASIHFDAGETKTLTFTVKNTGILDTETTGDFILNCINSNGDTTDSKIFTITFKAGVGVPDTIIPIHVYSASGLSPLGGMQTRITWGSGTSAQTITGSTSSDGTASFNIGKFTGPVTITVYDLAGIYQTQEKTIQVANFGVQTEVNFYLFKLGETDLTIWVLIALLTAGLIVFSTVLVKKRRRRK